MIGNAFAWGETGYSIVEEGDLNPATLSLTIHHYRVVNRKGEMLSEKFADLASARAFIEQQEVAKN